MPSPQYTLGQHHSEYDVHEHRLTEVSRLRLQQMSTREIAIELGVSQTTVYNYLIEIRAIWRSSAIRDWDEIKAQEIARIDELERNYWAGWNRSCEMAARQTIQVEQKEVLLPNTFGGVAKHVLKQMRASTVTEQGIGDPRFLDGVHKCIEQRCKILGLNAPQVVDIELRIREAARAEGLDEDAAVEEARRLIQEYVKAK